jgi:hypothetical protein
MSDLGMSDFLDFQAVFPALQVKAVRPLRVPTGSIRPLLREYLAKG